MIRFHVTSAVAAFALATLSPAFGSPLQPAAVSASTSPALVRVVHGSPDAGPVSVSVNGTAALKNFLYGTVTPYIALPAGTYKLAVTTAAGARVGLTAAVAAGKRYSIVATGELSPKATPSKPNIALTAYVDAPFISANPAINFHHAAPAVNAAVAFGIGFLAYPQDQRLGSATFGTETGPIELTNSEKFRPLEAYAVGVDAVTLVPNTIDPRDVLNALPSAAGENLSVFAVDGPAAASVPSVSGADTVRLIGAFDAKEP